MRECSRIYNMLKYIFEALTKRKHLTETRRKSDFNKKF